MTDELVEAVRRKLSSTYLDLPDIDPKTQLSWWNDWWEDVATFAVEAVREVEKSRCPRCWEEAKARTMHGYTHISTESWYEDLAGNEWCLKGAVR